MKMLSQRGVLLLGVMLAVCGFVPSMASAASWSVIGTTHQLFSPNLSFTTTLPAVGQVGWLCNGSELDADVVSANTIEITSARFSECRGTFVLNACTLTMTAAGLPWTATATATANVQIHGVDVGMVFENTPGNPTACALPFTSTLTGTLTGGSWNSASNELFLQHADGLTAHNAVLGGVSTLVGVTGTYRDTTNTLTMRDGTECTLV
jgi:hypothetical protein